MPAIGTAFDGLARGARIALYLAVALLLVVTHGCTAILAWNAKGNQVDAAKLQEVRVQAEIQGEQQRESARIDANIITAGARRDAARERTFQEIREEVPHVARSAAPVTVVQADCPVCDCGHGPGFVRVWNDALSATVPVPDAAGGTAQAAARPDPAAAEPDAFTVTSADVLRNHVDNAEIHSQNRSQCEDILTWHAKQKERRP